MWPGDLGHSCKPGIKRVNQTEQLGVGSQERVSSCEVATVGCASLAEGD